MAWALSLCKSSKGDSDMHPLWAYRIRPGSQPGTEHLHVSPSALCPGSFPLIAFHILYVLATLTFLLFPLGITMHLSLLLPCQGWPFPSFSPWSVPTHPLRQIKFCLLREYFSSLSKTLVLQIFTSASWSLLCMGLPNNLQFSFCPGFSFFYYDYLIVQVEILPHLVL